MNVADQTARWQSKSMIVALCGILASLAMLVLDSQQFLRAYLFAYLYWIGVALGCLAILLMHHVVGGKWGMIIRRLAEAGARTLPLMAILLLPVLFGMKSLYPWTRPEAAFDANIQSKALYLNVPFFVGRAIFYFAIWILYAYLLSRWSLELDRNKDETLIAKMRSVSAPGLVVFTLTTTFAFIDWIMSLEPHWFSTIYGVMFMIGGMLSAFAFLIALLIVLSKTPPLRDVVSPQHVHDLGNLMFAFMALWAYLSFSQFLIIWSGNLPQEIPWYVNRLRGGWGGVALALVVFHFVVPFLALLMRNNKRRERRLLVICLLLIVMRMVDVYWIVEPAFAGRRFHLDWMALFMAIAIGGAWFAAFFMALRSRSLVPLGDPRLQGAPRETVAF